MPSPKEQITIGNLISANKRETGLIKSENTFSSESNNKTWYAKVETKRKLSPLGSEKLEPRTTKFYNKCGAGILDVNSSGERIGIGGILLSPNTFASVASRSPPISDDADQTKSVKEIRIKRP